MQFHLRTLFLLLFVFASALAAFGAWGLLITPHLIALVMSARIGFARGNLTAMFIAGALFLALPCSALLSSSSRATRQPPTRPSCIANLRQIGIAFHNYQDHYGCYPPAYVPDAQGRPMHSWRVLLLPFMEENALYDRYDFSEPWDGPHNRRLAREIPMTYCCPEATASGARSPTATAYVAITGPGTAWPGPKGPRRSDFRDRSDQTILLVEATDAGIDWMEPRDLELSTLMAQGGKRLPIPTPNHDGTGHVLFVNESVGKPNKPLSYSLLTALATVNGGEPIDPEEADETLAWMPHRHRVLLRETPPAWTRTLAAAVFLVSLILLVSRPLPRRSRPDATDGNGQDSQD